MNAWDFIFGCIFTSIPITAVGYLKYERDVAWVNRARDAYDDGSSGYAFWLLYAFYLCLGMFHVVTFVLLVLIYPLIAALNLGMHMLPAYRESLRVTQQITLYERKRKSAFDSYLKLKKMSSDSDATAQLNEDCAQYMLRLATLYTYEIKVLKFGDPNAAEVEDLREDPPEDQVDSSCHGGILDVLGGCSNCVGFIYHRSRHVSFPEQCAYDPGGDCHHDRDDDRSGTCVDCGSPSPTVGDLQVCTCCAFNRIGSRTQVVWPHGSRYWRSGRPRTSVDRMVGITHETL